MTVLPAHPHHPRTSLLDVLSNDLVLRELTPYLDLRSLLALSATCRTSRALLRKPGSIHYIDLSSCSFHTVSKFLSLPHIAQSLRVLFLDNCSLDDELLTSLFLDFRLRHLSLCRSFGWSLEQLCEILQRYYINPLPVCAASLVAQEAARSKSAAAARHHAGRTSYSTSPASFSLSSAHSAASLASSPATDYEYNNSESYECFNDPEIDYAAAAAAEDDYLPPPIDGQHPQCCTPMCARRPTIKSLSLLGGPTFPTDSISVTAPIFQVIAREAGLATDLVSCEAHPANAAPLPLMPLLPDGSGPADGPAAPVGWFLAADSSKQCAECGNGAQRLCLRCSMLRTCSTCQKSWCTNCDPQASKARLDCYDCGPTCEDCRVGTVSFCKFCKAKYCRTHQEGSTELYCDWCSSRGGRNRHYF
ncbi:hypothetical protein BZA70DRAFT_273239 [Myxozyma melibiosi]|uniref:F-box domain-containing protein n=1 Tax=Myxozyma melibiosi TaxID=54550 RepID=A0ABR1FEG0_9ASCO